MKMKKIYTILFLLCFGIVQAQPQKINYQAVAVNASGVAVKNRVISLKLSILDSSATGSVLYSETHQPTTDGSGQFSVYLGGGTVVSGTFSNIPWGNTKAKFLKTESDYTGSSNYSLMGVSQLVSVPYALAAGSLGEGATITGANGSQYTLTVGTNGPEWQQSSGLGGLKMNFPCPGIPTVNYGGQTYHTVQIGNQCWFKENLNVGTMINGTSNQSNNSVVEKYCYNNLPANCDTFGGLYQWAEALQYQNGGSMIQFSNPRLNGNYKGICPSNWHVSSDQDFCKVTSFLDSTVDCSVYWWSGTDVGKKMNSVGSIWNANGSVQSNSSGFSVIPSGFRNSNGNFSEKGDNAYFWVETEHLDTHSVFRHFSSQVSNVYRYPWGKEFGFSIRCVKD